jgi:hypothetical protein
MSISNLELIERDENELLNEGDSNEKTEDLEKARRTFTYS